MNQPNIGLYRLRAWGVHFYTSLGLIVALLALAALVEGKPKLMFAFLGLALIIDGSDGPLARAWNVARWTPQFDGRKLDDITDYITYVFVPVFFMYQFEVVTGLWILVLPVILLASGYGFCRNSAKTDDHFFTGFPSYWNIVALYLYVLSAPVFVNAITLALLAMAVFSQFRFITGQTRLLRPVTTSLQLLWLLTLSLIVMNLDQPNRWVIYFSLMYPVYHLLLSFYLNIRDRIRPQETSQEAGA